MKELSPGKLYELKPFQQPDANFEKMYLRFVHREPVEPSMTLVTRMNGTTLREVLLACAACITELNKQLPCPQNKEALENIYQAVDHLEERKEEREKRGVLGKHIL